MFGAARNLPTILLLGAAAAALAGCGQRGPLYLPQDGGQPAAGTSSTSQFPPPGASGSHGPGTEATAPAGSARDSR